MVEAPVNFNISMNPSEPGNAVIVLGRNYVQSDAFQDRFRKGLECRGRLRVAGGGDDLRWKRGQVDDLRWLPERAIDRIDVIDDLGSISAGRWCRKGSLWSRIG